MPLTPEKHRFTVHFDVNSHVFHLLTGMARAHQTDPNTVARDILLAWILQVEKDVGSKSLVKPVTEE